MFDILKDIIDRSNYTFSFPYIIISLILNPFFFVRYNLFRNIKKLSINLNGDMLDFGCGCAPYKHLFDKCDNYVGMDIEVSGHDHTNSSIDVYYDGVTIPFEDEHFDSVFSSEVFEHVSNLDYIMKEINRVLKKDGNMIVTVPFTWFEHEIPYDFRRYTSYGIVKLLEENGFEIIEQRKSTKSVQMIFQLWQEYIRDLFSRISKNGVFQLIIQLLLIFPATIIGLVLSFILPDSDGFYGDNIILCKKV